MPHNAMLIRHHVKLDHIRVTLRKGFSFRKSNEMYIDAPVDVVNMAMMSVLMLRLNSRLSAFTNSFKGGRLSLLHRKATVPSSDGHMIHAVFVHSPAR